MTNSFTYVDQNGNPQSLNLNDLVKNNETVTTISQDLVAGTISYINEKNQTTVLNVKQTSSTAPWFNTATKAAATSNTDNVYITGSVGIGTDAPTTKLDVAGELRLRGVSDIVDAKAGLLLAVDKDGIVKTVANAVPIRSVWGVFQLPDDDAGRGAVLRIINPGSGDWHVNYLQTGTAVVTINNAFATIPVVSAGQYLTNNNSIDPVTDMSTKTIADATDRSGIDYVSRNRTQIWISAYYAGTIGFGGGNIRINNYQGRGRMVAFMMTGY